jgi:formamidopyrimidine-DNA glycosylase
MPELAEVEIVKRGLEPLLGGVLLDLSVKRDDIYRVFDPVKSLDQLVNSKLVEIHRHGKYLLFVFSKPNVPTDEDLILLIHLGMTGKLVYIGSEDMSLSPMQDLIRHKHTHLVFHFDKGILVFNDVRRFGKVRLFDRNLLYKTPLTLSNTRSGLPGPRFKPGISIRPRPKTSGFKNEILSPGSVDFSRFRQYLRR